MPSVLSKTIQQNDLSESNDDLFSFEMIIDVDNLKCDGQCPKLIQALAMLTIEIKYLSILIILFKIFP